MASEGAWRGTVRRHRHAVKGVAGCSQKTSLAPFSSWDYPRNGPHYFLILHLMQQPPDKRLGESESLDIVELDVSDCITILQD